MGGVALGSVIWLQH